MANKTVVKLIRERLRKSVPEYNAKLVKATGKQRITIQRALVNDPKVNKETKEEIIKASKDILTNEYLAFTRDLTKITQG